MNSNKKTAMILEDVKINVKIKLALLWVSLMFFYIYADVFSFFQPGIIEEIITGEVGDIEISQIFLLGGAILMAIPSFMVILSLTLKATVNRLVNIIVAIFHFIVLIGTLLVPGEIWAYYALYMIFEAVFIVLIVWHAWKWPTQEKAAATP